MRDQWTDRFSDYLDGGMGGTERQALEQHLAGCAECRSVLDQLTRVRARARVLPDQAPARDLWPEIAREIAGGPSRLSVRAFSVPQLLAAGVALMLLSGSAAWIAARRASPSAAAPPGPTAWHASTVWRSEAPYAAAVAQLQATLDEGRRSGALDTATVRVLLHSLAIVDTAILEARRALAADPASPYLNHHLADTMRRKLDLLRQASAITTPRT